MTATKSPYILSLDIGTSSTRALLFDATGSAVPAMVSQKTYQLTTSVEGEVSVDADKLVEIVTQTIDEVVQKAGELSSQIKAVAIDTFWHSLLGLDGEGHPLTPVITWEDTRAFAAARELRAEFRREDRPRSCRCTFSCQLLARQITLASAEPATNLQERQAMDLIWRIPASCAAREIRLYHLDGLSDRHDDY